MGEPNRILVVDDESYTLEFISYNLERQGFAVYTATNGQDALRLAMEVVPQMVLLDIMMPGIDGVETCIEMRRRKELRDTFIAFLTARAEDYSQIAGFEAGADDYIKKPVRMGVLIPRIKAHFKRLNKRQARRVIPVGDLLIYPDSHKVELCGRPLVLNRKEFHILQLLAENPNRTFSAHALYTNVWEPDTQVNARTVNVHISRLRKKLGRDVILTEGKDGYRILR
jgi:two-component system alkaline phosphatase synthesis response regulator PhoP